jgi:hypothetical protein
LGYIVVVGFGSIDSGLGITGDIDVEYVDGVYVYNDV